MIKVVFFDIDGTLVSFRTHAVPDSARQSIIRLREKGIKVFIATGRQLQAINNLGDLTFDGYITLNGSYCLAGRDQVIYKHRIAEKDIDSLIEYQEQVEPFPCIFVQEDAMYLNYKNERVEEVLKLLNFPEPPIRPLRDIPRKEVYQLLGFFGEKQEQRVLKFLPECEATRWSPLFTDVVPKGSSKRVGVNKVIEYYGFSLEETMAFGDGGNDIQMLEYVGLGIAMGNAKEEVKKAADDVTDSVDEDGIRNALEKYNLL